MALSWGRAAVLVTSGAGKRIDRFDADTGMLLGTRAVPARTAAELDIAGRRIVFRSGRTIYVMDAVTGATRVLARRRVTPVGLSIEGKRVAWAENVSGRGRMQAVVFR